MKCRKCFDFTRPLSGIRNYKNTSLKLRVTKKFEVRTRFHFYYEFFVIMWLHMVLIVHEINQNNI
jgi:hypothetical protein